MTDYTIDIPSYTVGVNAYKEIPKYCRPYGRKAVVIGGRKAMAAAREKLVRACEGSDIEILDFVLYGNEASYEAAEALEEMEPVQKADFIFAVGGGKAVDTTKLVAIALEKPFFTFPTLASNCAAASSLAIVYHPDGSFRDFVHYVDTTKHVFIDTDIIAHAPDEYLWAGIGDTCAKYFEVTTSAKGEKLPHYIRTGVNMSRLCMEILVDYGEQALRDNRQGLASEAMEECALAIIMTTGWVSMLVAREHNMDYNGGIAHALFYSLCEIPGFEADHIHGVVVGFGILMQLLMNGEEEECERMKEFNRRIGLPTSLRDMGVTVEDVAKVAERIIRDEDLEHFPYKPTVDQIMAAAERLK
ncbi:MAG: iron-containing alcohol dehydrogenase family protein [Lachnospiraceae bacterium]|nr:iron-containing alcohol dehydrogenase family protein [Lachnospiraceae bacterium]